MRTIYQLLLAALVLFGFGGKCGDGDSSGGNSAYIGVWVDENDLELPLLDQKYFEIATGGVYYERGTHNDTGEPWCAQCPWTELSENSVKIDCGSEYWSFVLQEDGTGHFCDEDGTTGCDEDVLIEADLPASLAEAECE